MPLTIGTGCDIAADLPRIGEDDPMAPSPQLRAYQQALCAVPGPPDAVLRALADRLAGVAGADLVPDVPPVLATPWLLGHAREGLVAAAERTARGAWFTPPDLARALVDAAGVAAPRSVMDPACGGGAFLLAAAERFPDAHIAGRDTDPLAVQVATAALSLAGCTDTDVREGDGLVPPDRRYHLVLGNPPFLSQLRTATARDAGRRRRMCQRFGGAADGYVDEAGLFLLATATDLLEEGGVGVLVLPEALLATAAAAPLRAEVARHCQVEVVWRDRDRVFPHAVTCAVRLQRRPAPPPSTAVCRATSLSAAQLDTLTGEVAVSPPDAPAGRTWSHLLDHGAPEVVLAPDLPGVGEAATATADFRDAYYLLVDHVCEEAQAAERSAHRIVPVGLIDPAHLRWGEVEVRFAKQRWQRPVALDLPPQFLDRRLGPKILVATQSRVLEALVDERGDLVPSTPVITIRTDQPWHVGAALTSPVLTALAVRRHAGAARSRDALKLSARQVLDLPLPRMNSASWDGAAEAYRLAHDVRDAGDRRLLLERCGRLMTAAYGVDDDGLIGWWLGRLPDRG
ncbi:hypothetical protein BH23ACT9_BH23ACT9_19720 [soil metagenome]